MGKGRSRRGCRKRIKKGDKERGCGDVGMGSGKGITEKDLESDQENGCRKGNVGQGSGKGI